MTRLRWAAAAGLVAVAVAVAVAIAVRGPSEHQVIDVDDGRRLALQACDDYDRFVAAVRRNASADEATRLLRRADQSAQDALERDPHWAPLASGVHAVSESIAHDSGQAARAGADVIAESCGDARGP